MTKQEKIDAIMFEAGQHGLAFVTDDFIDFDENDAVYLPEVDFETASAWLRSKLEEVMK